MLSSVKVCGTFLPAPSPLLPRPCHRRRFPRWHQLARQPRRDMRGNLDRRRDDPLTGRTQNPQRIRIRTRPRRRRIRRRQSPLQPRTETRPINNRLTAQQIHLLPPTPRQVITLDRQRRKHPRRPLRSEPHRPRSRIDPPHSTRKPRRRIPLLDRLDDHPLHKRQRPRIRPHRHSIDKHHPQTLRACMESVNPPGDLAAHRVSRRRRHLHGKTSPVTADDQPVSRPVRLGVKITDEIFHQTLSLTSNDNVVKRRHTQQQLTRKNVVPRILPARGQPAPRQARPPHSRRQTGQKTPMPPAPLRRANTHTTPLLVKGRRRRKRTQIDDPGAVHRPHAIEKPHVTRISRESGKLFDSDSPIRQHGPHDRAYDLNARRIKNTLPRFISRHDVAFETILPSRSDNTASLLSRRPEKHLPARPPAERIGVRPPRRMSPRRHTVNKRHVDRRKRRIERIDRLSRPPQAIHTRHAPAPKCARTH